MIINPQNPWYTDTMRICRVTNALDGNLTVQTRGDVKRNIPCRVYNQKKTDTKMNSTASTVSPGVYLACADNVDIREGDEVFVRRGAKLGYNKGVESRYFAGVPVEQYEPFGSASPKLAHLEVPLLGEARVKDGGVL